MKKLTLLTIALLAAGVVSMPAADAKAIWEKDCMKCHGVDGKVKPKWDKKLELKI